MSRTQINLLLVIALLAVHLLISYEVRHARAFEDVLPPAPSEREMELAALGDHEFLYRSLVMDLQNFGDTGGRVTRMADYDITHVVQWLRALDYLDPDANHHMKLATQYFAYIPDPDSLRALVDYVRTQVALTPRRHWQWLLEAVYIAQSKLHDNVLAAAIGDQLAQYDFPEMILIARQLPAALHRQIGDYEGAADMMSRVLERYRGSASAEEVQAMEFFIEAMRTRASQASQP